MSISILFERLGGLALFLYGMQMMSTNLEAVAGSRMKGLFGETFVEPSAGSYRGGGNHCIDSIVIRYNSYGSWICKFRINDTSPGCLDHYGCQYRYNDYRAARSA